MMSPAPVVIGRLRRSESRRLIRDFSRIRTVDAASYVGGFD
jgi:hypothetical protein